LSPPHFGLYTIPPFFKGQGGGLKLSRGG
jgi:hypothetical protein